MSFLKDRVFSRKSGIRNLVSLGLGVLVFIWFCLYMTWLSAETSFLEMLFGEALPRRWRYGDSICVMMWLSCAALGGGWIRRFGEKRGLRWLLKSGFSFLDAIPLVNLIAPLVYRSKWKKAGESTDFGDGLRGSLRRTVHDVLVTNNAIFEPDGKLKYGLIRFAFVAVFRILRGVFCLLGVLFVPLVAPLLPLLGWILVALVGIYDMTIAQWVARGAMILAIAICLVQPVIALLIHRKKADVAESVSGGASMPEFRYESTSGSDMPAYEPAPEEDPMPVMDDPDDAPDYGEEPGYGYDPDEESGYGGDPDDEEPGCGEDPDDGNSGYSSDPQPAVDTVYTEVSGDKEMGMTCAADQEDITAVPERNEDREIANYKEKDI